METGSVCRISQLVLDWSGNEVSNSLGIERDRMVKGGKYSIGFEETIIIMCTSMMRYSHLSPKPRRLIDMSGRIVSHWVRFNDDPIADPQWEALLLSGGNQLDSQRSMAKAAVSTASGAKRQRRPFGARGDMAQTEVFVRRRSSLIPSLHAKVTFLYLSCRWCHRCYCLRSCKFICGYGCVSKTVSPSRHRRRR